MKKRFLLIFIPVIILVSLNWFNELYAGDMNNLTSEEKAALLKKLTSADDAQAEQYYWETPELFDGTNAKSTNTDTSDFAAAKRATEYAGEETKPARMPDFSDLLPFGAELFSGDRGNEVPTDIPSADDYILGPGDNVILYLWGRADKQFNLTIDREGKVFIPQVGEIVGWGLTLDQFTKQAKKALSRVFSDFDLTVSLGKIRSMRVFVAGEVKQPGAYTVSSLTSLFNALYLAGGPNGRGSMRQITLMRNGEAVALCDLYDLLLRGDNSADVRLQSGDVIFVPVAGPQVAVRGEVKRSAIYELCSKERALELLELAGKPTAEAYLDRVMLERISPSKEWEVLDLNLNKEQTATVDDVPLVDGDRMTVYSIFEAKKNIVAVFGHVKHTGYYERSDSATVSSLIGRAQLQPYDVYFERADLFRRYPDRRLEVIPVDIAAILDGDRSKDIVLQDRDSLYVYSIDEVRWQRYVYIEGQVKKPGRYPLYDGMSAEDLIFLAGSYARGAYRHRIELARIDSVGNVTITHVDRGNDSIGMLALEEDDHLYVRQLPEWQSHRAVSITGEVMYPGEYTLSSRDETLYQLLLRAGGFTENAFPQGVIVERPTINDALSRMGVARMIENSTPLKEDSLGRVHQLNSVDFDRRAMNRLIIDMQTILATRGTKADIVLEPGDRISVPTIPSGISVIGAVGSNGTIRFSEHKPVEYYVEKAGNFTRQADKKETRLVRASGEVICGRGIMGKKVALGDVIIVPTKIERDRNWLKTFTTALTAATGVLTSVYIVSKL